ncbi:MAG: hypothetical protein MUC97_12490 [Bernardetiaceae bacterium]|jgi:hypothetical protein|nr:hypothetical protein [Bernardetiaceae bacterium]
MSQPNEYLAQRERLLREKEEFKQAIMQDVKETKSEIVDTTKLLVIGAGAILLGYLAVRVVDQLTSKKPTAGPPAEPLLQAEAPPTRERAPKAAPDFSLWHTIKEQLALFVVAFAKDKLLEFFEEVKARNKAG